MALHPRHFTPTELLSFVMERVGGVTSADVVDRFGCARETARRQLQALATARVGVQCVAASDGGRHRYVASPIGRLSAEQRWAVAVVRDVVVGLNGSRLVTALDAVIGDAPELQVELDTVVSIQDPEVAQVVYEAVHRRRRLFVDYAGARDTGPRRRHLEAHHLKQVGGVWYVTVTDLEDAAKTKTFKVARMTNPALTPASATHSVEVDDIYKNSVGIWDGPLSDVRIRIDGAAARHAHEFKLNITQREETTADGAVIVCATVAGLEETARWIWRWGSAAQALSPPALVDLCARELRAAAARYT